MSVCGRGRGGCGRRRRSRGSVRRWSAGTPIWPPSWVVSSVWGRVRVGCWRCWGRRGLGSRGGWGGGGGGGPGRGRCVRGGGVPFGEPGPHLPLLERVQ